MTNMKSRGEKETKPVLTANYGWVLKSIGGKAFICRPCGQQGDNDDKDTDVPSSDSMSSTDLSAEEFFLQWDAESDVPDRLVQCGCNDLCVCDDCRQEPLADDAGRVSETCPHSLVCM